MLKKRFIFLSSPSQKLYRLAKSDPALKHSLKHSLKNCSTIASNLLAIAQTLPHKIPKTLLINFYITPSLTIKRSLTALPNVWVKL